MANNPYVNKVEYAGQTLMDISNDTVTPSDVIDGVTFHDRSGAPQTGNLITHDVYDGLDSSSTEDALSANQGKVLNNIIETKFVNSIKANTNLNNLTDIGFHYCATSAIAQTLANNPAGSINFTMIVMCKSDLRTQVIFAGGNRIYTRTSTSSGWGHWYSYSGTDTGA